ncbi:MAG: hypothetical protein U1E23_06180 [Reyranellaceae bacterium]
MKSLDKLLLAVALANPMSAQAQGRSQGTPAAAPIALACGALKAQARSTGTTTEWSVTTPTETTTESGVLRGPPRFECLGGAVLTLEFASTAGHGVFEAYFPDGSTIAYGRQQVDRRGNRYVLPIQARARIAAPFRALFDYHCKLDMPADPIPPAARADCLF